MSSNSSPFSLKTDENGIAVLTFDLPGEKVNKLSTAVMEELDMIISGLEKKGPAKGLIIISGKEKGTLTRLLAGEDEGTLFLCGVDRQSKRQHWITEVLHSAGEIHIDAGAATALLEQGSSLLPVGVTAVEGVFDKGDCVEIVGPDGVVAKGLCNYTAEEMRRIMGHASSDIEAILGFHDFSSVIHRDNLVLISATGS